MEFLKLSPSESVKFIEKFTDDGTKDVLYDFFSQKFSFSVEIACARIKFLHLLREKNKSLIRNLCESTLTKNLTEVEAAQIWSIYICYLDGGAKTHVRFSGVRRNFSGITLTVTTCKRYDLFSQTIDSFLSCCTDHDQIDRWICVDDNSSAEDRLLMRKKYPFFEFYFKTTEEKGHAKSMNIIRRVVKSPYIFHMEDDWQFIRRYPFVGALMEVLWDSEARAKNVRQCLINKNYGERPEDLQILGGIFASTPGNTRYYVHEWTFDDNSRALWHQKNGNGPSCSYWPHFSLRPSLFFKDVIDDVGIFDEYNGHFEHEYALRYANREFKSAFLEGISSVHIGKLTNDTEGINAYKLNGVVQFSPQKIPAYVVNLKKRDDRRTKMETAVRGINSFSFQFYEAVDGASVNISSPRLYSLFQKNDYNFRTGIIGCAISHIELYLKLINSRDKMWGIFEDDIFFSSDFDGRVADLLNIMRGKNWDLIYLGHHSKESAYENIMPVRVARREYSESIHSSLGGTFGYLITREGAKKLLEFINEYGGMIHGIDTMQQKSSDRLRIYYTQPQLIESKCWSEDSNIQHSFEPLHVQIPTDFSPIHMFKDECGEWIKTIL